MQLSFEQTKNLKATVYTFLICTGLAFIFIVVQWQQTAPSILPPQPQFMEVNLGNSETGEGAIPPLSKDAPAPEVGANQFSKASANNQSIKVNNGVADEYDESITSKNNKNIKATTLPNNTKPKAVMGKYAGGNGKGGNNQDSYNNIKNQGITGGKSDQGVANGNINGNTYSGTGGPIVTKGDRRITKAYSFNGDVEPATIYAEIEVSPNGQGRFIQITRGSSSNDSKYKRAIMEYLTKINFNSSDHSSTVTVKFKFEVNN